MWQRIVSGRRMELIGTGRYKSTLIAARKNRSCVCPTASTIGPSRFDDFQRCSNLASRISSLREYKGTKSDMLRLATLLQVSSLYRDRFRNSRVRVAFAANRRWK